VNPKSTRWHFGSFSGKFRGAPMRASALLVPAFLAVLIASACSSQGEGDYCDQANGDNDCASGLKCTPAPGLATQTNNTRCCPISTPPTTEACTTPTGTIVDASVEIPDGFELGVPDAEGGAATDPGSDAKAGSDAEAGASDAAAAPDVGPSPDAADGAAE
jgi:hypothetical protein